VIVEGQSDVDESDLNVVMNEMNDVGVEAEDDPSGGDDDDGCW